MDSQTQKQTPTRFISMLDHCSGKWNVGPLLWKESTPSALGRKELNPCCRDLFGQDTAFCSVNYTEGAGNLKHIFWWLVLHTLIWNFLSKIQNNYMIYKCKHVSHHNVPWKTENIWSDWKLEIDILLNENAQYEHCMNMHMILSIKNMKIFHF